MRRRTKENSHAEPQANPRNRSRTDDAYIEAVYAARPGDNEEEEALRRLHGLKDSASYFREQVEVSRNAPEHSTVAFDRLNSDFIDAHETFVEFRAFREYQHLFETIEDAMGNLRFYYVSPDEYTRYPDYDVYPHYPGVDLFVHLRTPTVAFYFRHDTFWHLHPEYYTTFPYRVDYRFGYGRHNTHYVAAKPQPWHRKAPAKKTVARRGRKH